MATYYSSEYNRFGSTGWSAYRAVLELSKSSTTGNAKTTISWTVKVQMKYAWGYGVGIKMTGADSGSAAGHLSSNPGSTWVTVASKSDKLTVTGTTSSQVKKFTATAYGTVHNGYGSAGGSVSVSKEVSIPALKKYTIKYNANRGTGAPSSQTKYYGKSITLSTKKPTRAGYEFKKWNTKSNGTGTSYYPGDKLGANTDVTLYAIWETESYTITYNPNGGTSGSTIHQTKHYNQTMIISANAIPSRTGYKFLGWSPSSGATSATYKTNGAYTANGNATLYAVWQSNSYTITYKSGLGSGTDITTNKTIVGTSIALISNLPSGWDAPANTYLSGWQRTIEGQTITYGLGQNFSTKEVGNVELTAIYKSTNIYIDPTATINGNRIRSDDSVSSGGKRFEISYTWEKGRNGSTYYPGRLSIEYSNDLGETWNEYQSWTSFSDKGASVYTLTEAETETYVDNIFRITITDTQNGTTYSTSEISVSSRDTSVTEVSIEDFVAQRESNVSNTVNVSFYWEAFDDGNITFDETTEFTILAKTYRLVDGEPEWIGVDPMVTVSAIGDGGFVEATFSEEDDTEILVAYNAYFYISNITSTKTGETSHSYSYEEQIFGGVSQGGYPVHINSSGRGISLFGLAKDEQIGFNVHDNLKVFAKATIDNDLTVGGSTALNNSLTVGGTVTTRGSVIIPNNTFLYAKNNLNENRGLIRIANNNNLLIGSTTQREDFKKNGTTGGQTVVYGRGIYFYTGTSSSSNTGTTYIDTDGYIHINGHTTPIGANYSESFSDSTLSSGTSSYSWRGFGLGLGTGVWVVTMYGSFSDNNSGQRWITIGYGPSINNVTQLTGSTQTTNALGNGWATGLVTTGILALSSTQNVYIGMRQNSGNQLTISARCRAVRIR